MQSESQSPSGQRPTLTFVLFILLICAAVTGFAMYNDSKSKDQTINRLTRAADEAETKRKIRRPGVSMILEGVTYECHVSPKTRELLVPVLEAYGAVPADRTQEYGYLTIREEKGRLLVSFPSNERGPDTPGLSVHNLPRAAHDIALDVGGWLLQQEQYSLTVSREVSGVR